MPNKELSGNSSAQFEQILNETLRKNFAEENLPLLSDSQLNDRYETEEKKERYHSITQLLRDYGNSYYEKISFQKTYRRILFWTCAIIVFVFSCLAIKIAIYSVNNSQTIDFASAAVLVSALVSFAVAILKLIEIITKYCFPENDDDYIVKIVQSVQANDLEKYKEDNRASEARDVKEH